MSEFPVSLSVRLTILMLISAFLFAACGGGGSAPVANQPAPPLSTGTVAILLTDAPVDELSAINMDVTEVTLIGDGGQQSVFSGNLSINLLDLANFEQPVAFGEVEAGSYGKIRLRIENLELVDKNTGLSTFPSLPANGKIDLLDRDGFEVFPGRTLLVEIEIDANKSIHIVGTGSGKYQFRPVVKVNVMDGGLPAKLVRLEGIVAEILDGVAGRFRLCHVDNPESCVIVNKAEGAGVFGPDGQPVGIETLMVGDPVIAIGAFRHVDVDVELDAFVIEIGGIATQVKVVVLSEPDDNGKFVAGVGEDQEITVQLQEGTKIFGPDGVLGPEALLVGSVILVEGVVETTDNPDVNDLVWAALVFVGDAVEEEVLMGEVVEPLDPDTRTFNLATDTGDVCVEVPEKAKITLVSQTGDGTESKEGEFADIKLGQSVEVFGHSGVGGCFRANEVVVDLTAQP